MRSLAVAAGVALLILTEPGFAASVTLKSGEISLGEIVSETKSQLTINVACSTRGILGNRTFYVSDILSRSPDTAQEKQECQAYDSLRVYVLNPNQEATTNRCVAAMSALQGFLSLYPASPFVLEIQQTLRAWEEEYRNVAIGLVKYDNMWTSPVEKDAKVAWHKLETGRRELAKLETSRKALVRFN
jgi:hypothetical protein